MTTKKIEKSNFNQILPLKLIDKNAIQIIQTLNKNNFKAYLVGGCIRDILLGLIPKDFDIVTNAKPQQITKIFKRSRIIGRRFQIVHILSSRYHFIEVSTFRNIENNSSILKRDNNFGTLKTDAKRRDFTINALYYDFTNNKIIDLTNGLKDIKNRKIEIIGDVNLRFKQDPVRILRAIRFSIKLNFKISQEIQQAIYINKKLLTNIPPARLFEECLKLFHHNLSFQTYELLQKFDILQFLFPTIKNNKLIKIALDNTADRIKKGLKISPAFIFAIFLYDDYVAKFKYNKKSIKPLILAKQIAMKDSIYAQTKFVSIPKFIANKIKNTWSLQDKLEQNNPKQINKILNEKDFRMAFDFLILRSKSINLELEEIAKFWQKIQK